MELKSREFGENLALIHVSGRLTLEDIHRFEKEFEKFTGNKKSIGLELSGLKYIDSSGIGSLIKSMNMAKKLSIELMLIDIDAMIINIFKLAYLDKFFNIMTLEDLKNKYPDLKI